MYDRKRQSAGFSLFELVLALVIMTILAGIIPLKSAKMAHWLNDKVPGIRVPDVLIQRMDRAAGSSSEVENGVEIAAQVIRDVRPLCAGIHVMGLGWEDHIPAILSASAVRR